MLIAATPRRTQCSEQRLTRATNPIKLYEYFSCGVPVASSRLPEVQMFEDLVYTADSSASFPECIDRALQETDPEKQRKRMEAAGRETWSNRAKQLIEILPIRCLDAYKESQKAG